MSSKSNLCSTSSLNPKSKPHLKNSVRSTFHVSDASIAPTNLFLVPNTHGGQIDTDKHYASYVSCDEVLLWLQTTVISDSWNIIILSSLHHLVGPLLKWPIQSAIVYHF
ncbi:hypothetical protein Pst134EA_013802 [Puccinia striiformis f. sp. tritici]|uniref:hypothetical protein n=1 Tax=Puccinia striiformis f. sp. tritici TaxID=168172 RepID=UPI0020073354|nr:hypothetical protein Pst134EA_013802 [Puccinia striiformis f. sp. tritici]KAH9465947.1 hypothetical protein Pst134EA_013802 [Puccinia striiformis f. sp. tritici]